MKPTASACIAILMLVIAGCSRTDTLPSPTPAVNETPYPSPGPTLSAVPTDTPLPDFILGAVLQGDWLVEARYTAEDWKTLGTLTIDGNGYRFHQVPGVEIPSWMQERFCFFEKTTGEIVSEYIAGVSPNDDIRAFTDRHFLLTWAGIGCKETFFVAVDQDAQELYLHAQVSELQLYRIHKSYGS